MRLRFAAAVLLIMVAAAGPAAAQDGDTLTVSTGGVMLTINKDFATGISINQLPADSPEYGPGFAEPANTQISFSNPPPGFAPESILTIRLYPVSGLEAYPEHMRRFEQLQNLIANQSPLTEFMIYPDNAITDTLPFIPVYTHGQVLTARAGFVETPIMQGIRYVAAFAAAAEPFNSNSFVYTYQGVTRDGQYYISAQAFVTTDLFPADAAPIDPEVFQANFPAYVAESIATLNAGTAADFSPSLADVDAVMQSLTVTPMVGP
jgi:hypothetical protein